MYSPIPHTPSGPPTGRYGFELFGLEKFRVYLRVKGRKT